MIRIGSIGSGCRGVICKLAHQPDKGFELAMVCDTQRQVIEQYRKEFSPELAATDDWHQVVANKDLDAVFITTPDYLHADMAVAALEAGKAVYLEKPLAISIEDCDRVLQAAAGHGDRLYVGHNMRFFPVMLKMRELIEAGVIGQVQAIWCRHFVDYGGDAYFKDWHAQRCHVEGLLLQKGAHDIDIIHWLAGGYTQRTVGMGKLSVYNQVREHGQSSQSVSAELDQNHWPPLTQKGMNPRMDVEDHTMMLMQLDNGVQASYMQCHYTPDGWRNYTIIGTQGRIENQGDHATDDLDAKIQVWTKRCGDRLDACDTITLAPVSGTHGGADPQIVDDFLEFVKTGRTRAAATPMDARMAIAAGVMATRSLRQGNQPFDIPPVKTLRTFTTS